MLKGSHKNNAHLFRQVAPPLLKKGELRKLSIVEAAIECLSKVGWQNTNYETVARLCSMKRPHVAYHYPDWSVLMMTVIQFVYATGQGIVADHIRDVLDPKERLRAYINGTFHWLATHPTHGASITLLWHLATFDSKFRTLSSDIKSIGVQRVGAILREMDSPKGRRKTRADTALAIHALIVGRALEFLSTHSGDPRALARKTFNEAWDLGKRSLSI